MPIQKQIYVYVILLLVIYEGSQSGDTLWDLNFGLARGFFVDIDLDLVEFFGWAHLLVSLFRGLMIELILGLQGDFLILLYDELTLLDILDFFGKVLEHLLKLDRLVVKWADFVHFGKLFDVVSHVIEEFLVVGFYYVLHFQQSRLYLRSNFLFFLSVDLEVLTFTYRCATEQLLLQTYVRLFRIAAHYPFIYLVFVQKIQKLLWIFQIVFTEPH